MKSPLPEIRELALRRDRLENRRPGPLCWLLWSVLALTLSSAVQVSAGQQTEPQYYTKPAGGITLEQAADTVRRRTGGRVLSATPTGKGGERGYNVRVLVDGKRVKQYYVDAEGRMSSR